jgi:DNA-binding MarR family transcriptional regulator
MSYNLTDSLPYLLNRVGVHLGDRFGAQLVKYELSVPMYRILAALKQHKMKTLSELSEIVSVGTSTLSRTVKQLARRNLVTRVRPESNGRIVEIYLTQEGKTLLNQLIPIATHFEQIAIGEIDPIEIEELKDLLKRVGKNISQL